MKMSPKGIVVYLVEKNELSNINWAAQTNIAKRLLEKYKCEEIIYAIDYWKKTGFSMYSLGFLFKNMKEPQSMFNAEKNSLDGNSKERNWERIRQQDSQTKYGTQYPIDLFTES